MILSRAPLRVSFLGGGSDLPEYYTQNDNAATLSSSIDKYMYIALNKAPKDHYKIVYDNIEIKNSVEEIEHSRIKNIFKKYNVPLGYEVSSFCEFPTKGTGLGSSSSYTVAVLNALQAAKTKYELAQEAYHIERDLCGESLGKQDQFAAAFGGFNFIQYHSDQTVEVTPVSISADTLETLDRNFMMFYTGINRTANDILSCQANSIATNEKKKEIQGYIADFAVLGKKHLLKGNLKDFAYCIHHSWMIKKEISPKISNEIIDQYYADALSAGAIGGKLLGAGGGGFLLCYVEPEKQQQVRDALPLQEFKFKFEHEGARVIFNG